LKPIRNKPKWKDWIAQALLFVISLGLFMEGGTRLALWSGWLRHRILGYDNSSYRLQWIVLHRIHLEWTGPYAIYHPTRGWTLKPDIKDLTIFDRKTLNSNSKGLRGKAEYEYQRTAGKRRILVFGDSFTFGEEVSDDETYPHHLESALPNTEVLNFGMQGYGHDQMLLYLKEEGVKYHPDIVILGFAYLDIYRNLWTFFAYAKPKFELVSGRLELTNVPVPTPDRVLAQEPYRPKALDLAVILRDKFLWTVGKTDTEARNLTAPIFDAIVATTRSMGAVPVFVEMPVMEEIDDASDSLTRREQFLNTYCKDRGVACLFLRPRFRQEIKRGAKLKSKGHWDPEEHRLAAEQITDFLLSRVGLAPSAAAVK
jgi:hypothetical protein